MNASPSVGALVAIKVQPRASRDEIGEVSGAELKVKVTAPPVDSAANEAVLRLLADRLKCRRSQVQLARGNTSRHKVVLIQGLTAEEVRGRLCPAEKGLCDWVKNVPC